MEPDLIAKLGRKAFQQHLRPIHAPSVDGSVAIIGFDTEYADNGADLLSVQLSCGERRAFLPQSFKGDPFTLAKLELYARELLGSDWSEADRLYFVSYWSTAELSQIKNKWWLDAKVKRVHSSEVYNVAWESKDKKFLIYDLWHFFFPKPLSAVAPAFGYKKFAWDRANITRGDLEDPRFVEYAMNDPVIAEGIMEKLRAQYQRHGVDILATKTPASASMAVYRSRFLASHVTQKDYSLRRLAMRANKGGIAEAYVSGTLEALPGEAFQQWDYDSLYPRAALALRGLPLNREAWRYMDSSPPDESQGVCKVRFAFGAEEAYPCLPVVVSGGGMGYPTRGVSYCTVAEGREAERIGGRVEWLDCYHYAPEDVDDSFQRFIRSMLREKEAAAARGDEAGRIVAKNICNTGIGKLSQRRRGLDLEEAKKLSKDLGLPLEVILDRSFLLEEKSKQEPGECWMPEWHALVLGMARAIMHPFMRNAKSRVTSTDSLISLSGEARRAGLVGQNVDDVSTPNGHPFKLEGVGDRLQVVRQRLYQLDWRPLPGWGDGKRKVAHHALHLPNEEASWLMRATLPGQEAIYATSKKGTLREAIAGKRDFGSFYSRSMTYGARWGDKRALIASGESRPWRDMHEWTQALSLSA